MKMSPGTIRSTCGEDDNAERQNTCQCQQCGVEPVDDQHDAERRFPVAQPVDKRHAIRRLDKQHQINGQKQNDRKDRNDALALNLEAQHQQHEGGRQGRNDGRQNDPVVHGFPASPEAESSGLTSRSARSLPVSRKPRSARTTISAVMPKEMTMAVNTSACGSGSV